MKKNACPAKHPRTALRWFTLMLSEGDGTPSTKRVCFLLAVVTVISLCVGLFLRHGLETLVVDLAKTLLISAASAYGVSRFSEYGNAPAKPDAPRRSCGEPETPD